MTNSLELREYALLSNVPVIFCLYYTNQHAILGRWIYQWLIDFAREADPPAFHPFTLKLIKEKLPTWGRPLLGRSDYDLFLEGVFGPASAPVIDLKIEEAIKTNKVLFYNKELNQWELSGL